MNVFCVREESNIGTSQSRCPGRSSDTAGLQWHCPRPPGLRASSLVSATILSFFSLFPSFYSSLSLFLSQLRCRFTPLSSFSHNHSLGVLISPLLLNPRTASASFSTKKEFLIYLFICFFITFIFLILRWSFLSPVLYLKYNF